MPTAPPAVEVNAVSKSFGVTQALKSVTLSIGEATVHGLVGRNGAGKSTLVSILTGLTAPDGGTIEFSPRALGDKGTARRSPCATVFQQSQLFPYLTVAENLFLQADTPQIVNWPGLNRRATTLLQEWGLMIDARRPVHSLRIDERQLLEIARAFAADSRVIVLDEPTAALSGAQERNMLFRHIRRLRDEAGVTFLYISHYIEEIFELCDEVTVLRDGALVTTQPVANLTEDMVIRAMIGSAQGAENVGRAIPLADRSAQTPIVLSINGAFLSNRSSQQPFNEIRLREGEALGLVGAAGSGAIDCAETVAGFRKMKDSVIEVEGKRVPNGRPDSAIANGIAMVAAERHVAGLFPNLSVGKNISISALDGLSDFGLLSLSRERHMVRDLLDEVSIVASSPDQSITMLSGGNQQKAMFARALATKPHVLILCNPTVGVDVASKAAIYDIVRGMLRAGITLIIATEDELNDVEICDRVIVFKDGGPIRELGRERTREQVLGAVEGLGQ